MKFQRELKREDVSVNLTPLIDVVFLLLIFFMVTTTFSKDTSLNVTLPEADGSPLEPVTSQIDLVVTKDGHYVVNGRTVTNSNIDTLKQAIDEIGGGDNTVPMVITADAEATHQSVVTAMDAVGQLGFSRLNIATRQPGDSTE